MVFDISTDIQSVDILLKRSIMVSLDKRLSMVASMVRRGSRVADIGTDHAYLPVYLVQAGVCPRGIAADIRSGPLEAARRTVTEAGLTDNIVLRLGDGLAPVSPDDADDIVIAGMGGETIVEILSAADWVKNTRLRLVLQPMTRAEELRRWLLTNGFTITEERLVRDGHRLYPVLAATYTAAPSETDEFAFYAGFFSTEEGKPYREMMAEHLTRRAAGLHHAGDEVGAANVISIAERLRAITQE